MITDYTSLKASIVAYMKRQDLDAEAEIFIQLAEGSLNNNPEFRVREMSQSSTYISKDGLVPFYDDYLSLRSIRNTGGNALSLASPAIMAQSAGCSTCPRFYREEGRQLHISPVVDYVSLDITYYKKISALSDINTINWLLLKAPNIYLYGALIESTALVMNDERIGLWKSRYDEAVRQLIDADQGDRWSGSPTSVRLHDESTSCFTDEESYVEGGELPGPPKFIALIPDQVSDLNILYTHGVSQYFSGEVTGYALYDAPTWLTMDAETGVMSGVPNAGALLDGLTVSASNSYGAVASNEFGMRVLAEPSGPPRYDGDTDYLIYDWHCNVGIVQQYRGDFHFRIGGAVAAYSLLNAPSWMSIDATTGLISGTPLATEAATDVTIVATNSKGTDSSKTFNVQTLNEVNSHTHWRMYIYQTVNNSDPYSILNQLKFMETHGGVNIGVEANGAADSSVPWGPSQNQPAREAPFLAQVCSSNHWYGYSKADYTYINGSWLGYVFDVPRRIIEWMNCSGPEHVHQPVTYAAQYSDDGVTWTTIQGVVRESISDKRYENLIEEV